MREIKNSVTLKVDRNGKSREVHWDLDSLKENQRVQIERDENGDFQFYIVELNESEVGNE